MFRRMVRQALRLVLLATLVVLAMCACGGGRDAVDRPSLLPEEEKPLRPGEYRSEEFKPSFFFRVGKGWTNAPPEASHGGRVSVAVGLSCLVFRDGSLLRDQIKTFPAKTEAVSTSVGSTSTLFRYSRRRVCKWRFSGVPLDALAATLAVP